MPAYRDKRRGTWFASFYYTDWQGHRKLKKKRGFETKRDAKAFEEEFLRQSSRTCNMSFASMVEIYLEDMGFWTVDQFNDFIQHVPKLPARCGLSLLFWTGLRIGELLALTPADIDLEERTLTVNKSFQTIDGKEVITDPKTFKSRRVIPLPEKLCREIRHYLDALYDPDPNDRLFPFTKHYFHHQMREGCDACGLEKIRLHDGCIKIGLNQKHPHSKGRTDLVLFLFYKHKGGKNEEYS